MVWYVAPIRLRETLEDFSPAWKVPAPLEHAFGAALVVVTGEDEVVHQPPVADGPLQVLRRGRRGGLHRQQGSSEVGSDGDFLRRHDLHEIIKQLRERIMLPCGEGEGFLNLSEGVARGEVYMEISDGGTMRRVERGGRKLELNQGVELAHSLACSLTRSSSCCSSVSLSLAFLLIPPHSAYSSLVPRLQSLGRCDQRDRLIDKHTTPIFITSTDPF